MTCDIAAVVQVDVCSLLMTNSFRTVRCVTKAGRTRFCNPPLAPPPPHPHFFNSQKYLQLSPLIIYAVLSAKSFHKSSQYLCGDTERGVQKINNYYFFGGLTRFPLQSACLHFRRCDLTYYYYDWVKSTIDETILYHQIWLLTSSVYT